MDQTLHYRPTPPIFIPPSTSKLQRVDYYNLTLNHLSSAPDNATTQRLRQIAERRRDCLLSNAIGTEVTTPTPALSTPHPGVVRFDFETAPTGPAAIDPYSQFPSAASIDNELSRSCKDTGLSPSTISWMEGFLAQNRIPDTGRVFPAWFLAASYYLTSAQSTSRPTATPRHSHNKEAIGQDVLKCSRLEFKQLSLEGITGSWIRLLCPKGGGTCCNAAEAWSWAMILGDESTDTDGAWVSESAADILFVETIRGDMPGGAAEAELWTTDHVAFSPSLQVPPSRFPPDADAMACRLLNAGLYCTYYGLARCRLSPMVLSAYYRSARASVLINDLMGYDSDLAHGQANLLAHGYASGRGDFHSYVFSCVLGDFHELFDMANASFRRPLAAFLFIWATQFGSQRYPQYHDKVARPHSPIVRVCRRTNFGDFSWDDVTERGRWDRSKYTDSPITCRGIGAWQDTVTKVYFGAVATSHGCLTGDWPNWADTLLDLFVDGVDLGFMIAAFAPVTHLLAPEQLAYTGGASSPL